MPMKTSNLVIRITMGVLLLGILAYFGVYIYRSCTGGLATVRVYEASVDIGVRASGLVVRREVPLTAGAAASVDISPGEGEKVPGGGVVATLYASPAGLGTRQAIRALEAELEQLQYAKSPSAGADLSARTEEDLLSSMAGLHASASAGDLSGLERDALRLRALVFRQAYASTGSVQELDALIARKSQELDALRASLGTVSTVIRAPESGVFSAAADGYETLLYPELLDDLTAVQLTGLENREVAPPIDSIGKLITSSTWYYAASAPTEEVKDLLEGRQYAVSFARNQQQAPMTLERRGDDEGGRTLLVFSSRQDLAGTTLLRRQTAEVVTRHITGLRIPRSALRALKKTEQRTVTDGNGKEQTVEEEVTVTGVFAVISRQADFLPVTVLYQDEDSFLVAPADPDAAGRLRAGDEILVYTAGITDGKVVR